MMAERLVGVVVGAKRSTPVRRRSPSLMYRMASFHVPPIWGFFALCWLERNEHL